MFSMCNSALNACWEWEFPTCVFSVFWWNFVPLWCCFGTARRAFQFAR